MDLSAPSSPSRPLLGGRVDNLDPEVIDVGILLSPPPKGLGLALDDRAVAETLQKNPDSLGKDAIAYLLKKRFVTNIGQKVFAVRATSLPNVVRALGRLLVLSNVHNRKMFEEFRGSGTLEELMTRMGVVVGEGRYALAGDLLNAFREFHQLGEGLDAVESDSGLDFIEGQPDQRETSPSATQEVRNKYVYNALVMEFCKIACYRGYREEEEAPTREHQPDAGFVEYCCNYLEQIMRVMSQARSMKQLMAARPLIPILQRLGELPPEVAYKTCGWLCHISTHYRCAPMHEMDTCVEALKQLLAERASDETASYRIYNLIRSTRYWVLGTSRGLDRFKTYWFRTEIIQTLTQIVSCERPGVAAYATTLAADTLLHLVKGSRENAEMVVRVGARRAIEFLLSKDTHFAEGVALLTVLMRELAVGLNDAPVSECDQLPWALRDFNDLLGAMLRDFERRFLTGAFDDSTGDLFAHNIASAYVRGLAATASVAYTPSTWAGPSVGRHGPPVAEGKTFKQCIMTLHAMLALLVPDLVGAPDRSSDGQADVAVDGIPFVTPDVLSSMRRYRGEALRWLTLKPSSPAPLVASFTRALRVRKAFLRAGAVDKILSMFEQCVSKLEADEWPLSGLCSKDGDRMPFAAFSSENTGGDGQVSTQGREEITALAEFVGCSLLTFSCALSRLHPANSVEGWSSGVSSARTLSLFRSLAVILARLTRRTYGPLSNGDARVPKAVVHFQLRFLLSMCLGQYTALVDHVVGPLLGQSVVNSAPNLVMQELHSPRALLLVLELLFELPFTLPEFAVFIPAAQSVLDFTGRVLRCERNLEVALDAGLVQSVLWCCLRPAATSEPVENSLLSLLSFAARRSIGPDDLRIWLNAVLWDYDDATEANARTEARRLNLLRVLVEVAHGMKGFARIGAAVSSSTASDDTASTANGMAGFLKRRFGHVHGSAPIVAFDPSGDERSTLGPRLNVPSLHPEGLDDPAPGEDKANRAKAWPPARGYTISVWFRIDSYDRFTRRLPLMSLVEDNDVLTAVEIHDGLVTVYANVGGKEMQSATLDRMHRLVEGEWYQLTLVHVRRRKDSTQPVLAAFLNGTFVQVIKLGYPRQGPGMHKVGLLMGQAREKAGSPARLRWTLGPTYLFADALPEGPALALYAMGPWGTQTFIGDEGACVVPMAVDLCTPMQLKTLYAAMGGKDGRPPDAQSSHGPRKEKTESSTVKGQFTDLPTCPLIEQTGILPEWLAFCLVGREATERQGSLESVAAYSAFCITEPLKVELNGGAVAVVRRRAADSLRSTCQFPLVPLLMLAERATTVQELELSLELLLAVTHAHPGNLQAMEKGHFYAILAQLLRRKLRQGLIVPATVKPLLAMVGRLRLQGLIEDGQVDLYVAPLNLQALQHVIFSFDIWKTAPPSVHRLILESLEVSLAITDKGNEAQTAAQELSLRRLQFAGITRAFLYMLIEPEVGYELFLNMCDLIYLVLTRGPPPMEDLHAVAHLLVVSTSSRFVKLYTEDPMFTQPVGSVDGGLPQRLDPATIAGRQVRLKVIRRGLLSLFLKVAEHFVVKTGGKPPSAVEKDDPVHLLLRALPPKYLLYIMYHFSDTPFWAGMTQPKTDAPKPRVFRRHQDPVSALLAYQLLVTLIPYASKLYESSSMRHHFNLILPAAFKSLAVQVESNMPTLEPDQETWGTHYIWQSKLLAREAADVSSFFGATASGGAAPSAPTGAGPTSPQHSSSPPPQVQSHAICSPTYLQALRTLYRNMYGHLLGSFSSLSTVEQAFDLPQPRKEALPPLQMCFPIVLPATVSVISAAAAMSTVEGLCQMVTARPSARGDAIDLSSTSFVAARSSAAKVWAEKGLRLLNNMYVESMELKEILRGEAASSRPAGINAKQSKSSHNIEMLDELVQVYYSGILAQLAHNFRPRMDGNPTRTSARARIKTVFTGAEAVASLSKKQSPRSRMSIAGEGSDAKDDVGVSTSTATTLTEPLEKAGSSPICRLALRLLIGVCFDRLLHQSRAATDIKALCTTMPRDAHIFSPVATFAETLQAHFHSVLIHSLLNEIRLRLSEDSGTSAVTYLNPSNFKLSHNLPKFMNLVAQLMFLSRNFVESPYLPPISGPTCTQGDFWLVTNMQFNVDLLRLVQVRQTDAGPDAPMGACFRHKANKSGALGTVFGLSKWIGDELDEWILSAMDNFRKAVLTGLGLLEDNLQESTVSQLFDFIIRHLGLLLPQQTTQRAAEADKQFTAALLHFLYPLLSDEKQQYREASMYIFRELLTSGPHRKIMESLLSVPIRVPGTGGGGGSSAPALRAAFGVGKKDQDRTVTLNLLTCNGTEGEGFDLIVRINVANFKFLQQLPTKLPPPRQVKGVQMGGDFADKEFQSWLGSMDGDIQREIPKTLLQYGRDFRNWPEATTMSALKDYREGLKNAVQRRFKTNQKDLKAVAGNINVLRKELKTKQDLELRRQVRWRQERLDRETFGARHMDVLFSELIDGCSLATKPFSVHGLERVAVSAATLKESQVDREASHSADQLQTKLVMEQMRTMTLEFDDGGLFDHTTEGMGPGDLMLDAAEGPHRERKKVVRSIVLLGPSSTRSIVTALPPATVATGVAAQPTPASPSPLRDAEGGIPRPPSPQKQPQLSITPPPPPVLQQQSLGSPTHGAQQGAVSGLETDDPDFDFFSESFDDDEREEDEGEEEETEDEHGEEEEEDGGAEEEEETAAQNDHTSANKKKLTLKGLEKQKQPAAVASRQEESVSAAAPPEDDDDENEEDLVGADDKLKPFLVPGDEIRYRYNCARVQGVYAYPGLLLLGGGFLYMIDNYRLEHTQDKDGHGGILGFGGLKGPDYEVVEIADQMESTSTVTPSAPPAHGGEEGNINWLSTPMLGNNRVVISEKLRSKCSPDATGGPSHRCHYWSYEEVTKVFRRRYHLRHVAIEVLLANGETHLVTFDDPATRTEVYTKLQSRCPALNEGKSTLDDVQNFFNIADSPQKYTEQWVRGQITNFEYLMHLNTLSGRSYNDLTQYPVVPWVIADWECDELDLSNPAVYRDLTKPMGAINPARETEFRERFELLREGEASGDGRKAFHYGTHYSSAAIVLYYMLRMQPFAEQHVRLQSGRFDHPDRLFSTMHKSWLASSGGLSASAQDGQGGSSSSTNTQDVRELIPEFFYLPDFLENNNKYDFGPMLDGTKIDGVGLPPWAKGSAHEFIRLHRQALESDYVNKNLHHWIDLIWGYKQRGRPAEDACNVYYYLTYEGAVDLESVEDPNLRKAYVEQIHEFGQTPSQLFKAPHPAKQAAAGVSTDEKSGPAWLKKLPYTLRTSGAYTAAASAALATSPPLEEISMAARAALEASDDGPVPTDLAQAHRASSSAGLPSGPLGPPQIQSSARSMVKAGSATGLASMPRQWYFTEIKKTMSSELALRYMPSRRLTSCVSSKVIERMASITRPSANDGVSLDARAVGQLILGDTKVLQLAPGCAGLGPGYTDFVAWGFQDECLRLATATPNDNTVMPERRLTIPVDAAGSVSAIAAAADGRILVTGSSSTPVLYVWRLQSRASRQKSTKKQQPLVAVGSLISALHAGGITNVALSSTYGIVVSICSGNRAVLLWDLNRRRLVRQLKLMRPRPPMDASAELHTVAIDDVTGAIVVTSGAVIHVYDVNGSPMAVADLSSHPGVRAPSSVSACCVMGDGCSPTTVLSGHLDGCIRIWTLEHQPSSNTSDGAEAAAKGETADDGSGDDDDGSEDDGEGDEGRRAESTLNLVTEVHCPYAGKEHRPPVTALTMAGDMKRWVSGDASGLVALWSCGPQGGK